MYEYSEEDSLYERIKKYIQGVFEVEVFLLTCDRMRCTKEF
jgi:hypothetical protein